MTIGKQRIKQEAAKRRRSSFRDEFYKEARKRQASQSVKAPRAEVRIARRVPLWVTTGGLGIVLCAIAIGGSSAMIWLRKIGALFGVYWIGD